ncbi:MAG: glycosyltransferase, partial [Candidatus Micrarchaeaceae archaeon]
IKNERKIIFAGRFIKEKTIDKWLEIFKKVISLDKTIKGVIIGNGIEKNNIQKLVIKLDLEKNVVIKQFYKDKKELYRELASSSVFLHMSEREGLSIIVLESLQCNTPVVLPKYTPIPIEVSSMCVIKNEVDIPNTILDIINKNNVKIDGKKLNFFSSKGVLEFYDNLFKQIKEK